MSITRKPFRKWDLERWFYTDPLLSTTDRAVARQILAQMDNAFRPAVLSLKSQAFIGGRVACWRETVNRSLRKLCTLGYFAKSRITVQRQTKQGIKGVTRVLVELGEVTRPLVDNGRGKTSSSAHSVISHHPPRTPPGTMGSVCPDVVTKSADRRGDAPRLDSESKREALAQWPRLAGSKPETTDPVPRGVPIEVIRDPDKLRAWTAEQDDRLAAMMSKRRAAPNGRNT